MPEKKPFLIRDFEGGWITEIISDGLPFNASPDLQNVDISASKSVRKTWGYEELSEDAEDADIVRLMVVPDRQGIQFLFKKVGTKIKVLDEIMDRWDTVIVSLTDGDVPVSEYFDGTVYFISKVDNAQQLDLFKSTRLTADVLAAAGTVPVDDTSAFASAGTFYLNSVLVTYTSKNATNFLGCVNTPASLDNSRIFASATDVGGANQIPKGDITAQYAGRLLVLINSTIYASKLDDLTNFTVTGSGTGDAIQKTVESKGTAMRVFFDDNNNVRLLSFTADNKIYVHDILDDADLSLTVMTLSVFKQNVTALNQLSTLVGPNDLYHIDQRNQVRSLGPTKAKDGINKLYSDVLSKSHERLFRNEYDFDNSRSVIYNDEYWCIAKEGSGDVNNRLVIFNFDKVHWRKRIGPNPSDIALYNGKVIFSDSTTNKVLQFDELLMADDGESIPFKYSTPDLDLEKLNFERLMRFRIAGFISTNCTAEAKAYSDFATKLLGEFTISGENTEITGIKNGKEGVIGSVVFGNQVIGGESEGLDIRFFIADLQIDSTPDLENFRIVFENDESNVYFEITAVKPFVQTMDKNYWPKEKIIQTN